MTDSQQPLWTPCAGRRTASQMQGFINWLERTSGHGFSDYDDLHLWSTHEREDFWQAIWDYCDVIASHEATAVLSDGDKMPGARWFEGARLNFAENLLAPAQNPAFRNKAALVFRNEDPAQRRSLTYAELYTQVAQLAQAMRAAGVEAGDRVAAFMPNVPETVITMLAAASIGALFSSCSPDFGLQGVLDRFGQIQPKLLIATQGYLYAGKTIDCGERVAAIRDALQLPPQQLISVPYPGLVLSKPQGSVSWQDFITSSQQQWSEDDIEFAQLPFDQPLYILYSSGTTGVPKCIVHGAGGTLLQHQKELRLHTDVRADDVLFYFTTCGWMMWNWLVSGLATGATLVLFDGSPFHPAPDVLWNMAAEEGITIFGTSAKYLSALEKAGIKPAHLHQQQHLQQHQQEKPHKVRTLLSTGSPLAHESFDYVYRDIGADIALCSISGGTDIISCFALGSPLLPVYRGELQCAGLGMAVEIWDEEGRALAPGEKGELVCTRAFPSMPVGFWNDPDGQKYHDAYFSRYSAQKPDGVWAHGDYAERVAHHGKDSGETAGLIIHGRSDAVLNPGGVRIGTAEIYRQVEQLDEVLESLAIGQPWAGDVRVVLFVVLNNGLTLDDALRDKIRSQIRSHCTPRHVPAKIIQVAELPRTISGKLVELAVRNVVQGLPVKNTDALKNPEALQHFRDLEELQHD